MNKIKSNVSSCYMLKWPCEFIRRTRAHTSTLRNKQSSSNIRENLFISQKKTKLANKRYDYQKKFIVFRYEYEVLISIE